MYYGSRTARREQGAVGDCEVVARRDNQHTPIEELPMPWIKTIPMEQAAPELRKVYEAIYSLYPAEYAEPVPAVMRPDGGSDSVTAAHSLIPEAMRYMMSGLAVAMQPHLPLTRRQQEMIASVVSIQNQCFY
jgi:hypothetical protein